MKPVTMKACVYRQYGPPGVISIEQVALPVIKENELLIEVVYSTVNRTDAGFRSAEYFISRFWSGLLKPKYPVLGCEYAGIVVETGSAVTRFKTGDKVFGFNDKTFGGHAEYLAVAETSAVATLPGDMSFELAAALTEGAHYAWVDIKAAGVKKGNNVLVYGASGAIGSAAVQILNTMDVTLTAVCNSKNVALIQSLGINRVIDYQTQDFTATQDRYDFIFDAVGKSSFGVCRKLLKDNGIYISTELGKNGENIWYALTTSWRKGKKLLFPIPTATQEDIKFLKTLAELGKYKPVIDRTYNIDEIQDAYTYVESGQKTGNVLLKIRP